MVTNAGGGFGHYENLALTRWREDPTTDHWGSFCYVRDVTTGAVWSAAYQPTLATPNHYEAIFPQGRAEFRRRDEDLEMHTEIAVSPEDDIGLRRYCITNLSRALRVIELTSYAEVVLATPGRRRSPSRVLQLVRPDRNTLGQAGHSLYSPSPERHRRLLERLELLLVQAAASPTYGTGGRGTPDAANTCP